MRITYYQFLLLLFFSSIEYTQTFRSNIPELVWVVGGDFNMGCNSENNIHCISDEKPSVHIELYDFWIGKHEITNIQYAQFLTQSGNRKEGSKNWYKLDKYSLINETEDGTFRSVKGFENYPVTNVTWYGAKAYTEWLSKQTDKYFRLPTEAEWEYAARGGQKSKGYIFSGSDTPEEVAWFSNYAAGSKTGWNFKMDKGTHPVGSKLPNELGIYDMSGNASEWCEDVYENIYQGGINPTGPKTGSLRVLRGGSWDSKSNQCRVSARNFAQHVSRFSVNKGFRIVMEKDISSKIDSFAMENDFNGTILVSKKDKTIYHKSFGLSNREKNIFNNNKTQYPIASITKLFTSVIILQLVEEGLINLNNEISHYLPDYKGQAGDFVTVHQLLTHTSGMENCETKQTDSLKLPDIYLDNVSTDKLLQKYCSGNLTHEPGSTFDYDNGEYIILGKIIESVTQDTYQNVLAQRILKPLNMLKSDLITDTDSTPNLAQGYKWDVENKFYTKDPDRLFQNYYSAGAMFANAEDISKFAKALFYDKILIKERSIELLIQTYPETKGYGYGLWSRYPRYNNTVAKVLQRFGRIWGINSLVSYIIDHDITIIVLANSNKVYVSDFQTIVGEQLLN